MKSVANANSFKTNFDVFPKSGTKTGLREQYHEKNTATELDIL